MFTGLHFTGFIALANKSLPGPPVFDASGANITTWTWGAHDADWIYQGGPVQTTAMIHDLTHNAWDDLDDSPAPFTNITVPVDMTEVDPWLSSVGQGIY
jgi:hypothetical protein